MPVEPRDEQITIRIPKRLRDSLEAEANRERRSVADVINIILEDRYPEVAKHSPTFEVVGRPAVAAHPYGQPDNSKIQSLPRGLGAGKRSPRKAR